MRPVWLIAWSGGAWWDQWSSPRTLGLMLWIGLALITFSLLVLMGTRWGQTKPLSKCIVLSLFAHVLFLGYASGTKLVFDCPNMPRDEVLRLSLLAPGDEVFPDPQEGARHWKEPWAAATADVVAPSPERQASDPIDWDAVAQSAAPVVNVRPDAHAPMSEEPVRETAPLPSPPVPRGHGPAQSELTLENSPPSLVEESPLQPESGTLPRIAGGDTRENLASSVSSPPDEVLYEVGSLQRLSDIPIQTAPSDMAAGPDDLSATTESQSPSAVRDSGPPAADAQRAVPAAAPQLGAAGDLTQFLAALPTVRRLADSLPIPDLLKLRNAANRAVISAQLGGSAETEAAVEAALAWLAANQEPDGRWDAARHGGIREEKVLGHDRQTAGSGADTGVTGLAILAFLGAGHTHLEGAYRKTVQRGLEYLVAVQKANGSLAGEARLFARMYCHGIAALALSESLAMTGDDRLRPFVENAVRYTVAAQHAGTGGWRYQPGDPGDTSQLGWQLMALRSAELAGVAVPSSAHQGAQRFLASVTSGPRHGLASYRAGEAPSRSMTAEALLCRLFLGQREPAAVQEATSYLLQQPPGDGQANLYYWYYATLSLFQIQGDAWVRWNEALQEQLLRRQRTDGQFAGSWDTDTVWGGYGGRVYTTALAAMCLEVYYRYLPILGAAPANE